MLRAVLDQVHGAFGATPNMFRAVANSPAALQSMWAAFGALGGGVVGAALGEQIAVAVANRNACDYCLAAHTALGRKAGVSGRPQLLSLFIDDLMREDVAVGAREAA